MDVRAGLSAMIVARAGTGKTTTTKEVVKWAKMIMPDIESAAGSIVGAVNLVRDFRNALPGDFVLSRVNRDLVHAHREFRRLGKPSAILGSAFASKLKTLIRFSKAQDVPELQAWLIGYRLRRLAEINAEESDQFRRHARIEETTDRVESLQLLTEEAGSISEVVARIDAAYTFPNPQMITLSSVHQTKGLEADRVWLLADTFAYYREHFGRQYFFEQGFPTSTEDGNLAYVAATRAKVELNIVVGTRHIGDV